MATIPFLANIDLNKSELLNAKLQNLATAPILTVGGDKGYMYWDTTLLTARWWTGTTWKSLEAINTLTEDISVVLSAGKSLGRYTGTTTIPAIGLTLEAVLRDIALEYLTPTFSSFSISGQTTPIEVGSTLSGSKSFTWVTTNPTNITNDTFQVRDINTNLLIANGLPNTVPASINIGTITNTSPISQSWRVEATNTLAASLQSANYTVTSIYPYFWGKVASGGAASGLNRPTANQALINSGTKVVTASTNAISITFSATADDYLWFAIPSTSTSKTVWYNTALNNGVIGGTGNLFPVFDTVPITTVNWAGIDYKIYISNYQSATSGAIEMRNS